MVITIWILIKKRVEKREVISNYAVFAGSKKR